MRDSGCNVSTGGGIKKNLQRAVPPNGTDWLIKGMQVSAVNLGVAWL